MENTTDNGISIEGIAAAALDRDMSKAAVLDIVARAALSVAADLGLSGAAAEEFAKNVGGSVARKIIDAGAAIAGVR